MASALTCERRCALSTFQRIEILGSQIDNTQSTPTALRSLNECWLLQVSRVRYNFHQSTTLRLFLVPTWRLFQLPSTLYGSTDLPQLQNRAVSSNFQFIWLKHKISFIITKLTIELMTNNYFPYKSLSSKFFLHSCFFVVLSVNNLRYSTNLDTK